MPLTETGTGSPRPKHLNVADAPMSHGYIDVLNKTAWELRRQNPERAQQQAEEAYALAMQAIYARGQAESLLVLSFVHISVGEINAAEEATVQAKKLLSAADRLPLAKVHNLLGIISGERGELSSALEHILEAHALFKQVGDKSEAANSLGNAALINTYMGDYDSALELHLETLKLHEAIPNPDGVARTLSGLGMAYYEMGDHSESLNYLLRCLDLEATEADPNSHALVLMNIGRAYTATDKLQQALSFTRQGINMLETLGDRSGLSYALDTLGTIYSEQNDLALAQAQFERALEIKTSLGDRIGQAITRLALGKLFLRQGQQETALETLRLALSNARESEGKAEIYKAHLALADAFEQTGAFQEALRHHRAYARVKDDVFNETSDRTVQSLRASFEMRQAEKEREIYRLKNVELVETNRQKEALLTQLERQAQEDSLTGLYNRRYFDMCLAKAFDEAKRLEVPLSIMICDIDNFKRINDSFSHQVGDQVLVAVAQLFKKVIRKSDTIARYGGEEFVLLMPSTTLDNALASCERLRQAVERYPWHEIAPSLAVTLSGGISADLSLASGEKMVARADILLYKAKNSGRNRLMVDDMIEK